MTDKEFALLVQKKEEKYGQAHAYMWACDMIENEIIIIENFYGKSKKN